MKFGKIAAATAAVALAATPIAAQADLSRAAAPVADASENGGEGTAGAILAVFAIAALVIGIASGSERPTSA